MNHVMVDLETLGTRSTSIFLSLAAVQFNIHTGKIGSTFNKNISMNSGMAANLTVDADTVKWWMKQNSDIRNKMFESANLLQDVLVEFSEFLYTIEEETSVELKLWGNAASFDLGILGNAYDAVHLSRPWKFFQERCYRTINSEFEDLSANVERENAHDPLQDCYYQIKKLCQVWKVISLEPYSKDTTQKAMEFLFELQLNASPAVAQLNDRVRRFLMEPRRADYRFENPKSNIHDNKD